MKSYNEMTGKHEFTLALFYCQNVPASSEEERQILEEKFAPSLRFFPFPCSGRLEPLHFLKALEEFADAAYLITCPEDQCRYFEGNARAKKRVETTRQILSDIGLETERVGIVVGSKGATEGLAKSAAQILDKTIPLGISPVFSGKY